LGELVEELLGQTDASLLVLCGYSLRLLNDLLLVLDCAGIRGTVRNIYNQIVIASTHRPDPYNGIQHCESTYLSVERLGSPRS
jgi:hypothetical protein